MTAAPETKQVTLTSRGGFLGSSLRVKLQAAQGEDGLYSIDRTEWDRTLGPVFERMSGSILGNNRKAIDNTTPLGVQHAYGAMTSEQNHGFHRLMQAFGAASDPDYTKNLGPDYAAQLQRFATAYKDGHVLADRAQLEALTTIARVGTEFARCDDKFNHIDGFFKDHVTANPQMRYRHGFLHSFS
jgi:hypothetical protein